MNRLFTLDDIIETYTKLNQRGLRFISSKFNFNETHRAKTAFNHFNIDSANCWSIPKVKERWLNLITGNPKMSVEKFVMENYLKNTNNLKMLSLGSGSCSSELKFARYKNFSEILCTDLAEKPLAIAKRNADIDNLNNIFFKALNANTFDFEANKYDIVYFKASLHHFKNVKWFLENKILKTLKKDGFLIIDEYVGPTRLQFSKNQITAINKALSLIPKIYKKRYKSNFKKRRVYGPGLIRMIIADPSECIDSARIMPSIKENFNTIYEANYGGNIICLALKDLAHHFLQLNNEKEVILNSIFTFEDEYLKTNNSDYLFGIYSPK